MSTTPEAYVHLSTDKTTLTFYYDTLRADRKGIKCGIRNRKDYRDPSPPSNGVMTIMIGVALPISTLALLSLMLRSVIFAPPPRQDGFMSSTYLKA